MPMRTVLGFVAYVADTGAGKPAILKGAQGQVYSVNDVGLTTPLACRDIATEEVIPNPVSNEDGYIGGFKVSISESADGILWVAGEYPIYQPFLGVQGPKGVKGDTGDVTAAQLGTAQATATSNAIADATTKYGALPSRLTNLDGLGQRGYVIDQTVGRTVKVWDYLNNREQLVYGDTGERDITALISPAPVSGKLFLSRENNRVQMEFENLVLQAAASSYVSFGSVLPSGFRARSVYLYFNTVARSSAEDVSGVRIERYGVVGVYGVKANENQYGVFTWRTNDPWPASLPGTPV